MPAVSADVLAKRGAFMRLVRPIEHGDGAVFDPDRRRALEQALDLGRGGRGGEIEVVVFETQQVVAHRATDAPGLISGGFELRGDLDDRVGNGKSGGKRHGGALARVDHGTGGGGGGPPALPAPPAPPPRPPPPLP